jgi:hypothetical protein
VVVVFALGLVWFLLGEMVSNKGFGHIIGQNLSKLENRINEKKIIKKKKKNIPFHLFVH